MRQLTLLDHPSKECETNTITMETSVSYVVRAYKKRLDEFNVYVTVIHKFYTCIAMLCVVRCCAMLEPRAQSSYDKILYSTHTPGLIWLWLWNYVCNGYMEGKNVEATATQATKQKKKKKKMKIKRRRRGKIHETKKNVYFKRQ